MEAEENQLVKNKDEKAVETPEQKEARKKLYSYQTRTFYFMFELIFIFGLPAAGAVFLGNWLGNQFDAGRIFLYVFLGIAFILSWIVVILRARRITRELNALRDELNKTHNN